MKGVITTALALAMSGPLVAQHDGHETVNTDRLWADTHITESVLISAGKEKPGPRQTEELTFTEWSGRHFIRQIVKTEMDGRETGVDTLFYNRATLEPVRIRSHNVWQGSVALDVSENRVQGTRTSAEGEETAIDATLSRTAYHMASLPLVLRSLELSEDFSTQLPILAADNASIRWVGVSVENVEHVHSADGQEVGAYVVSTVWGEAGGGARYWIAQNSGMVLKSEASWGDTTMKSWPVSGPTDKQ